MISAGSSSSGDRVLMRLWRFVAGFEVEEEACLLAFGEETCGVLARLEAAEEI